ncbi:MAG: DUF6290 family protein [Lysobacteraceae bacterium]
MRKSATSIRLTDAEHALITSAARSRGMSLRDFIRTAVLERIDNPQLNDKVAIAFRMLTDRASEMLADAIEQMAVERQAEIEALRDEQQQHRMMLQKDLVKFYNAFAELLPTLGAQDFESESRGTRSNPSTSSGPSIAERLHRARKNPSHKPQEET